ncbi:LysR family transcriptional regulator [Actinoalloteichus sp. AHMU CJ021]|uniref:LysR family transcriptional regulator n=1 Tax=Actinoalloteichus TaxID=65496 RepID=UPI00042651C6|nr:LysR family transcriptional regulator [Actinoalloteichus sp. AHMU CJ021]
MLDVRRLQTLRAVITTGSITSAATNLGYTPSAVSQQIGTLERETGSALLERVGRGVRPTAAGRLLAEHAATIGKGISEAEAALADLRAGRTGSLTIPYVATAGANLVAPALARLRSTHPGIGVTLRTSADPVPEVLRGEADLGVAVRSAGWSGTPPHLVPLADDPYRLVLPPGHRLATRDAVPLSELAHEPWVGAEPPGPCRDVVLTACAAAGFTPSPVVDGVDYATAQGFVAAGLGVALVPALALHGPHPGVVVRAVRHPEPVRPIIAVTRHASGEQPAVEAALAAFHAAARASQVTPEARGT